ncbi:DUF1214 domain-containing protein [Pleurocapsa sp. PCC 7319]|uniref:DUF1214 domain-containing protein n=1 Tax=Pleurocapsa sp. PCC 7319 TaxID=118161 RepID=UPI001ED9924F|nr:DUF1214 domain-containing protein [Pleurocapsa sp. PCC 7319]
MVNGVWRQANLSVAGPLDFVTYSTVKEKYGIITSNMNTPYMMAFPNLKETGPLILEVPAGPTGGILNDIEHRHIADIGQAGPDKGQGGKYLILHESWEEPKDANADFIIRSQTYLFWVGTRILTNDREESKQLIEGHNLYPLGSESKTKVISIGDKEYRGWHPDGMDYWKALHAIIQIEDFPAEDRYMLQFLARVGIEKGKPFNPTDKQQEILLEAEKVGKVMAMSLSAARDRFTGRFYDDGTKWTVHLGGISNSDHINENGMKELDGLVSYSWEAISMSDGMMKELVGVGSKYLAAYADADGNWFDGSHTYQLTVPPNVPAKQFWSFIVYSHKTRTFIRNQDLKPGISSRDELQKNEDGSVTIAIGPERPENVPESNFIYSNPDEGWFTYFRTYAPTEAYFEKTWRLPDIQRVE